MNYNVFSLLQWVTRLNAFSHPLMKIFMCTYLFMKRGNMKYPELLRLSCEHVIGRFGLQVRSSSNPPTSKVFMEVSSVVEIGTRLDIGTHKCVPLWYTFHFRRLLMARTVTSFWARYIYVGSFKVFTGLDIPLDAYVPIQGVSTISAVRSYRWLGCRILNRLFRGGCQTLFILCACVFSEFKIVSCH